MAYQYELQGLTLEEANQMVCNCSCYDCCCHNCRQRAICAELQDSPCEGSCAHCGDNLGK